MYWKIFHPSRPFHYATIIVGAVVFCWMIATLSTQIFSCSPIEGAWNILIESSCINTVQFYYGNAISYLLTDVIILLLPLRLVWRLQMSLGKKVGLMGVVMLGSLWVSLISWHHSFRSFFKRVYKQCASYRDLWTDYRGYNLSALSTLEPFLLTKTY